MLLSGCDALESVTRDVLPMEQNQSTSSRGLLLPSAVRLKDVKTTAVNQIESKNLIDMMDSARSILCFYSFNCSFIYFFCLFYLCCISKGFLFRSLRDPIPCRFAVWQHRKPSPHVYILLLFLLFSSPFGR